MSGTERAVYLVCYDIVEPRRLTRVHRFLRQHALAVQYSVFAGTFRRAVLNTLVRGIGELIDGEADDVRIYAVPRHPKIYMAGRQDGVASAGLLDTELGKFLRVHLGQTGGDQKYKNE